MREIQGESFPGGTLPPARAARPHARCRLRRDRFSYHHVLIGGSRRTAGSMPVAWRTELRVEGMSLLPCGSGFHVVEFGSYRENFGRSPRIAANPRSRFSWIAVTPIDISTFCFRLTRRGPISSSNAFSFRLKGATALEICRGLLFSDRPPPGYELSRLSRIARAS